KVVVLYEYETFKAIEGELLLDTYIRYLQKKTIMVTSDILALIAEKTKISKRKEKVTVSSDSDGSDDELKKITALLAKAFNQNKFYSKPTNNNLRSSSATSSANKKQEFVKSDDKKEDKKVEEKKRDMSKVKCYNCKKEGHFAKDCKKAKVKDYEYYKTKMLLAKKDKDEQMLLAEDHAWMESSSDSDQEINANMIIIYLEDGVVSFLAKEKENLETIEYLKSKGVESSEKEISESENQSENDCQVVKNVCDDLENPNMISPGMFKLSVSQSDSPISVSKTSYASKKVQTKLKRKRRKRTSSNHNVNQVNSVVSCANKDFVYFSDLDTFNSVRRPKPSDFVWKKKRPSNIVKDNLSSVHHSNLNKNVKRYSRKDLMLYNNSHLRDTRSEFDCNNARNALCNARMNDYVDVNDLFVFDAVSTRKSQVSKMIFRKKPSASLNVPSKSKLNKSLPRIMRCSKHMMGNRALLTNFVEKFLGTVRFRNNDFAVIAGYGDVVIGSMMIKRVYYVEGLDKAFEVIISFIKKSEVNLQLQVQRVRIDNGTEFKNKTLAKFFNEVGISQQFSAARTPQQNGVVERRNRNLIEAARTMLTFAKLPLFLWAEAITTACFTQNRSIIYKCFDKTPYELINMRKPNIKFFYVFGCRCYLLNAYDDVRKLKAKGDIEVFVGYSKDSAAFRGKSSNPTISQVKETSKKDLEDLFHNFYDEYFDASKISKSLTTNVETSNNEGEVFYEVFELFQEESSSSSLNDDVQQSLKEIILPQTNTQSILNAMIPNVDEASSSHNVFNERLKDAYFDTKSEYVAIFGWCAQVLWMRTQLTDYGFFYDKVSIYCDSKSTIAISCNPVHHSPTKHIDVRYYFIKDHVEKGTIELYFVGTEYQLADLFTKSLPEARFKFLVEMLEEVDIRVYRSFGSFFLVVIKSLSLEYEHEAMNLTLLERGFPARSVRSSNAHALDSLYLRVSLYRTPQSRLPH
nr:retrovirus-related Pol polyprotein from transposon TNT 1-94 [Tanacetum cinerariifolium]